MKEFKHLDDILKMLLHFDDFISVAKIDGNIELSRKEINEHLSYLMDEGYIISETKPEKTQGVYINIEHVKITLKGKLFIRKGGYAEIIKKETSEKNLKSLLQIFAFVAGFWALIEFLRWIYPFFCSCVF